MTPKKICVVIPTKNEQENIIEIVNSINVFFKKTPENIITIIIVDDSTDDTKIHIKKTKISPQVEQLLIQKEVRQRSVELSNQEKTGHLYKRAKDDLDSTYWWDHSDRYLSSSCMMFHHYLLLDKPTIKELKICLDILKIKYLKDDKKSKLISTIYEIFDGAKLLQDVDIQNAYEHIIQK